jgi:hypothetical protein
MLDRQTLADSALCVFDFSIDLISGNIHEPCRDVGHQRLKAQALLQFDLEIRS